MITIDQYERLQAGDTITYQFTGTIRDFGADFDLYLKDADGHETYHTSNELRHMTVGEVSAEQPKHDPTRLFKKGDVVEYRPKDGRANPNLLVGRRYKVSVDEPCDSGIVQVECDGLRHIDTFVAYNNIELVTPVEELEPYSVHAIVGDNGKTAFFAVRKGDVSVAAFFCDTSRAFTEEQARAAAEAERDRLNAEHRKEQNND